MKNFFSLVSIILTASAKSIESFTSEITKEDRTLNLLIEVVKEVIPAVQESGVIEAAEKAQNAASVLGRTLSRMRHDVKLELSEELPRSSEFFAIDDRTDGAGKDAIAWVLKADFAANVGKTMQELEEDLSQDIRFLQNDIRFASEDLKDETDDAKRVKLQKKVEDAKRQLKRRFGIIA